MSDAPDDDWKQNGMMTVEELYTEALEKFRSENSGNVSPERLEAFSEYRQSILASLIPLLTRGESREELIKVAATQLPLHLDNAMMRAEITALRVKNTEKTAEITELRVKNTEKTAEITELRTELARVNTEKTAEITALRVENTEKTSAIAGRSLRWLLEKRDKFEFVDRTDSDAHLSVTTHKKAVMELRKVDLDQVSVPEEVWNAPYTPPPEVKKDIDSEAMVVAEVVKVLEAILAGLGVIDRVRIATNRVIAGIEIDIVFLLGSQRIPFAAIEVKKPGRENVKELVFSPDSKNGMAGYVQGQNLDQLNALKLMGLKSVFGMITNGNTWMITGTAEWTLERKDDWDLCNLKKEMREYWDATKAILSPEQLTLELKENGTAYSEDIPRKLFVSQHVSLPITDDVIKLVAMFIRLACNSISPPSLGKLDLNSLSCRVLNLHEREGTRMCCSFKKLTLPKVDFTSCVDFENAKNIYLIHHLGSGESGDCCLAVTKTGDQKCCVVKFFLKQEGEFTRRQLAIKEWKNWKEIYWESGFLPKGHLGYLPNDDGYICMPYLKPIPMAQRSSRIIDGSVEKALRHFLEVGFKHDEVYWRHFGLFEKNLYLLDLGGVTKFGPGDDKEKWVEASLENLRGRLSGPVSTPLAPNHLTFTDQQQGDRLNSINDLQQEGGGTLVCSASDQKGIKIAKKRERKKAIGSVRSRKKGERNDH